MFSLKNEGVIAVFRKIMRMTSRDRKCVGEARKWRHSVRKLLAIILVLTRSLWLKNWLRKCVFRKIHVCDHLWPSRSPQVTGHGVKWKSIYEFLSMNNCNYRSIWHRYWDIDMQHFCNHGYIFERRFSPIFFQEPIVFNIILFIFVMNMIMHMMFIVIVYQVLLPYCIIW